MYRQNNIYRFLSPTGAKRLAEGKLETIIILHKKDINYQIKCKSEFYERETRQMSRGYQMANNEDQTK